MTLNIRRCEEMFGNTNVLEADPEVRTYEDVIYDPRHHALYDKYGRIITDSAYFRYPDPEFLHAAGLVDPGRYRTVPELDLGNVVYLGPLHCHFGHFLLATFSRLWFTASANRERSSTGSQVRLLSYGPAETILDAQPYMDELLSFAGIGRDRLISFDRPVRLRTVTVPGPGLVEGGYVHEAFRTLCAGIGERIGPADRPAGSQIVYVAKDRLSRGISRFVNEDELVARFEEVGIEIWRPERLNVAAQIARLRATDVVISAVGSALHTLAFAPPTRLVLLAHNSRMLTNQMLIDRVCGHEAVYVYAPGTTCRPGTAFESEFELPQPRDVADCLVDIARTLGIPSAASPGVAPRLAMERFWSDTTLRNLALRKPCRQSSLWHASISRNAETDAGQAVSGFLTGGFQFHTEHEHEPWWEVDLGRSSPISRILLFNRLDPSGERACRIRIMTSLDGAEWSAIEHCWPLPPFGGADGRPFEWVAPTPRRARYVRLVLKDSEYLHLDQVAVLGEPG